MSSKPSVFINGAGLAGSACAIRLRQLGHSVVLIDQAKFPREKLCGEFLGPDAMPLLKKLGLLEAVLEQCTMKTNLVNIYSQDGKGLLVNLSWLRSDYPYALATPRSTLDLIFLRHAQTLGASVKEEHRIEEYSYQVHNNQFELLVNSCVLSSQAQCLLGSEILVDAAGRNSHLSKRGKKETELPEDCPDTRGNLIIEPHVGVQSHVSLKCSSPELNMYFFPGGYGGIQPITADTANICLWVKPELAKIATKDFYAFLDASIGQNSAFQMFSRSIQCQGPIKTVGGIQALHKKRAVSQSILSIGDALLTVEPFSGFGMVHALKTGILAAEVIDQGIQAGWSYSQILNRYLNCYQTQFYAHLLMLQWLRPIIRNSFLQKVCWPVLPVVLPTLSKLYR